MGRHSQLKRKLRKLLPAVTVTLTTVPFAAWSPTAEAFFPPVWPVSPPVTVVPPAVPPVVVPPTVPPPPFVPPPPVVPPVIVPPPVVPPIIVSPPPPPSGTPEPATLVSSVIGLAAAAGYGLRKRKQKDGAGK